MISENLFSSNLFCFLKTEIDVKKLSTLLVKPFKTKYHFIILFYYSDRDLTVSIITTRNLT